MEKSILTTVSACPTGSDSTQGYSDVKFRAEYHNFRYSHRILTQKRLAGSDTGFKILTKSITRSQELFLAPMRLRGMTEPLCVLGSFGTLVQRLVLTFTGHDAILLIFNSGIKYILNYI